MMFKVSDDLATLTGLSKEATPEAFESRIIDLVAQVEGHQSMNKELLASVSALEARILALEGKTASLSEDQINSIVAKAEAAAQMKAAQEVSAAIAKAGAINAAATAAEPEPAKVEPTIREQFAAIKDPVARGRFWEQHREALMQSL